MELELELDEISCLSALSAYAMLCHAMLCFATRMHMPVMLLFSPLLLLLYVILLL